MDKATLIGAGLAMFTLIGGMILKHADPTMLISPAALVIIFVGTFACIFIGFPMSEIKKVPKLLKIAFTEQKTTTEKELLPLFIEWARIVRKEGIIGLEEASKEIDVPLLKKGFDMILEGQDSKDVEEMLELDLEATSERHAGFSQIFTQAGGYAPTLGVLGAVMGLISALGNLSDINAVGHNISAAFMATIWGIFSGYVMWLPIAQKLKRKSAREIQVGHFIIKGIVCLQEDASPIVMERKLTPFIPVSEQKEALKGTDGGENNG